MLNGRNYIEALNLLKERFGNPQLLISTHMQNLLILPRLTDGDDIEELSFHNAIESNIRSLLASRWARCKTVWTATYSSDIRAFTRDIEITRQSYIRKRELGN